MSALDDTSVPVSTLGDDASAPGDDARARDVTDSRDVGEIEAVEIALPAGFVVVDLPIARDEDAHDVGRRAGEAAIAIVAPGSRLAYDGTRPIVVSLDGGSTTPSRVCVSITHTHDRAIAITARCTRLGVDLVDHRDIARIERIAPRYLADERTLLEDPSDRSDPSGPSEPSDPSGPSEPSEPSDPSDPSDARDARDARDAILHRVASLRRAERYAQCFAAKEAALKALGLGLLDGGAFDRAWPVRVVSLDPPRLAGAELTLVLGRAGASTIAVAYS